MAGFVNDNLRIVEIVHHSSANRKRVAFQSEGVCQSFDDDDFFNGVFSGKPTG